MTIFISNFKSNCYLSCVLLIELPVNTTLSGVKGRKENILYLYSLLFPFYFGYNFKLGFNSICHSFLELPLMASASGGELYFPCSSVQLFSSNKNMYFCVRLSDCSHVIRILLNFYAFNFFPLPSFGPFFFLVVLFGGWKKC